MASSSFPPRIIGPFSLAIPPTTYCPGSDVQGELLLEFPKVQDDQIDEVTVQLRGSMDVSALYFAQRIPSVEMRELIYVKKSLWTRGSAYPPSDSHILRIPFSFHLPAGPKILPSVSWDEYRDHVLISYDIEAIALRPRTFFAHDKRIRQRLAVVSRGDPVLCASIMSLREVEGGPTWKTVHREKQMRRGIWGEYSTARVELLIPNQHGILPHCIDIPLLIKVKSTTARLARAKADKHPEGKPIFPAPEFDAGSPMFVRMRQKFTVRTGGAGDTKDSTNEIVLASIKPEDLRPGAYHKSWEADAAPGDREEMGRWVQRWTLQPTVKLNRFPPTFSCELVDCAYTISVEVPFAGMGNSIEVSMPVTLDSGIDHAVPLKSGRGAAARQQHVATVGSIDASVGGAADISREEEPQSMPPTYFDAVYGDGEEDGARDAAVSVPEKQRS